MQENLSYTYTKLREQIWQIAEDDGVYCTLVRGSELAVLIDTGWGRRNLRKFVEQNITTPYMVINSHGHPDHVGGNHWFDTVFAMEEEWELVDHFAETPQTYERKNIKEGEKISLGNLHMEVVPLAGHTKASVGFLIPEERMLLAGDAMNGQLWLFNYGSLSMKQLYDTLKETMCLDFDTYVCAHSTEEYKKEHILLHIKNIENLKVEEDSRQNLLGFETYRSVYEDAAGTSEIVFTRDRL